METGGLTLHLNEKVSRKKKLYKSETNNKLALLPKTRRDSFGLSSIVTPLRVLNAAMHWYFFGYDLLALVIVNPNIVGSVESTYPCTLPLSGVFPISLV